MKYLKLIILFLLVSCGTDQWVSNKTNFTVGNETGNSIIIKSYKSSNPEIEPFTIALEDGESQTKTFEDNLIPNSTFSIGNFFGNKEDSRDSVIVIYDQNFYQIFVAECSENMRNPLNLCREQDDAYNQTFVFNSDNLNDAIECDENCN